MALRQATPQDLPLVYSTWIRNYQHSQPSKPLLPTLYPSLQHNAIERLLERAQCVLACSPQDPDVIFGWCVGEHLDNVLIIDYTYIKPHFRRLGIGNVLIGHLGQADRVAYTHETVTGRKIGRKRGWHFQPWLSHRGCCT